MSSGSDRETSAGLAALDYINESVVQRQTAAAARPCDFHQLTVIIHDNNQYQSRQYSLIVICESLYCVSHIIVSGGK